MTAQNDRGNGPLRRDAGNSFPGMNPVSQVQEHETDCIIARGTKWPKFSPLPRIYTRPGRILLPLQYSLRVRLRAL